MMGKDLFDAYIYIFIFRSFLYIFINYMMGKDLFDA